MLIRPVQVYDFHIFTLSLDHFRFVDAGTSFHRISLLDHLAVLYVSLWLVIAFTSMLMVASLSLMTNQEAQLRQRIEVESLTDRDFSLFSQAYSLKQYAIPRRRFV